jgi:hypothetical protein
MFPFERFYGFLKSLVHNWLFPEGAIVHGDETIEAVEWAMVIWTHKTPLACLSHGMKVCFQVLGPWEKVSHSGCRCLPKGSFAVIQQLHLITPFAIEHKRQLCEANPDRVRAWLAKMHMQGFSW